MKGSLTDVKKTHLYRLFFYCLYLKKYLEVGKITSKHEVIIQVKEKNNIILNQNRKSIYWTSSPVNTLFVVYKKKFLKEIFRFFYNFLSTSVVGSEREQGLSLLEGMEGGELLWSNLLPAEM